MRPGCRRVLLVLAGVAAAVLLAAATPPRAVGSASPDSGSGWQPLTSLPSFNPGVMFLLTDGQVMVQDQGASNSGTGAWWLLTPDAQGSYADGTWTQAASMATGYAPLYGASAVLPDGRLIVEGGEYNGGVAAWTNQGAIYDPVANTWTTVSPPSGWLRIADAPSVVLADGRYLLGASGFRGAKDQAILDPSNLTWTTTGAGKTGGNPEAGFTLLPNGKVLTVDADLDSCGQAGRSEIYDPVSGTWTSAGLAPSPLVPCAGDSPGEIGPQLGMYDGKVFVEGGTAATALYDTASGTWSAGPQFPVLGGQQFVAADAASAILPDGKVLLDASPGTGDTPTHFFLFDGASLTQIADDAGSAIESSHDGYMLVLPTGQVLFDYRRGPSSLELYSDGGTPNPAWAPHITSVPTALAAGQTYAISGTQLNGLSEGAAFGDDYQMSTDYPLVQITDVATGTVTYARTSGMTSRSIAPGAASCTDFTLPAGIPKGSAELRVIANGIASGPVSVTVGATGANTATCGPPLETLTVTSSGSGAGTVSSSPAGIACGSICSHEFAAGAAVTLTASPAAGSSFDGWSGACTGTGTCQFNMASNVSVGALFDSIPKPDCVVPRVIGRRLAAAKTAVVRGHCAVGKVTKAFSSKVKSGRVIYQKPRPGTRLAAGSRVRLTVSKGKKR
jgi:Divergent InlB B-repeat domain/PASTA domain